MEEYEVLQLLSKAVEIGYNKARIDMGDLKPYISKNEAFRLYGRKTVERWINEGLIEVQQDGKNNSRIRMERIRLDILAASSNRS